MIAVNDLLPKEDGRGIVVGMSGSGKTYLSRSLIMGIERLIVIDPKRMFKPLPGMKVFNDPIKLIKSKSTFAMYRPSEDLLDDMESYNKVYKYAYLLGDITVYTDEIIGVITETRFPKYLKICYQMGREKKVRMITTTQRPAWIPLFLISECNAFYIFELVMMKDIKRMQECCPKYRPEALREDFTFWYTDLNKRDSFPARIT